MADVEHPKPNHNKATAQSIDDLLEGYKSHVTDKKKLDARAFEVNAHWDELYGIVKKHVGQHLDDDGGSKPVLGYKDQHDEEKDGSSSKGRKWAEDLAARLITYGAKAKFPGIEGQLEKAVKNGDFTMLKALAGSVAGIPYEALVEAILDEKDLVGAARDSNSGLGQFFAAYSMNLSKHEQERREKADRIATLAETNTHVQGKIEDYLSELTDKYGLEFSGPLDAENVGKLLGASEAMHAGDASKDALLKRYKFLKEKEKKD